MDEYQLYEKQISEAIAKYRKTRDRDQYRKILHELDMYELFLDQNFAAKQKYDWHAEQKKLVNQLKQEKEIKNTKEIIESSPKRLLNEGEQPTTDNVGMEIVRVLEQDIDKGLKGAQKSLQKAIEVSAYIRIQLDRQINLLDDIYEENKKMENRLKRVKQGLIIILRRAMMNKLTRLLAILLVLAVIGLVVLYILRGNGVV